MIREQVSAAELKAAWFGPASTGMIHDHQTREVVVTMNDGRQLACGFDEFDRFKRGEQA